MNNFDYESEYITIIVIINIVLSIIFFYTNNLILYFCNYIENSNFSFRSTINKFKNIEEKKLIDKNLDKINNINFCIICGEDYIVYKQQNTIIKDKSLKKKFDKTHNNIMLKCNHIFHKECLSKWINYNKKCPVCGIKIEEK